MDDDPTVSRPARPHESDAQAWAEPLSGSLDETLDRPHEPATDWAVERPSVRYEVRGLRGQGGLGRVRMWLGRGAEGEALVIDGLAMLPALADV